jgi:hypothetical protein
MRGDILNIHFERPFPYRHRYPAYPTSNNPFAHARGGDISEEAVILKPSSVAAGTAGTAGTAASAGGICTTAAATTTFLKLAQRSVIRFLSSSHANLALIYPSVDTAGTDVVVGGSYHL